MELFPQEKAVALSYCEFWSMGFLILCSKQKVDKGKRGTPHFRNDHVLLARTVRGLHHHLCVL